MSDQITATIDTYIDMWNEPDADRRLELIRSAWAPGGAYVDPQLQAEGHAALSDMVASVHEQFPGHRFARRSAVDAHHGLVRFAWDLTGPDGSLTVGGVDVGVLDDDGRLSRIAGFFGDLVPEELAA